jgi:hypothetical protein
MISQAIVLSVKVRSRSKSKVPADYFASDRRAVSAAPCGQRIRLLENLRAPGGKVGPALGLFNAALLYEA